MAAGTGKAVRPEVAVAEETVLLGDSGGARSAAARPAGGGGREARLDRGRWHWLRSARGWIAAALAVVSIVFLATSAQLPSLQQAASRANHGLLAVAFFLGTLTIVCKAARWRALYEPRARPSLGLSIAGIAVGQVANWAVPARLGEILRVGMVTPESARGVRTSEGLALSVGVLVAEKLLDGLMLVLAVLLLAAFGGLPGWLRISGFTLVACTGVGGLAVVLVVRASPGGRRVLRRALGLVARALPARLAFLLDHVEALAGGLGSWLGTWRGVEVGAWSLGAWGIGGLVNYAVLRSLGIDGGIGPALAVLVALYGGAAVPSLPGRIGVFQYLCVLPLTPFGVDFDQALAFSLALYAVVYVPPMVLGLLSAALIGFSGRERRRGPSKAGKSWQPEPNPPWRVAAVPGNLLTRLLRGRAVEDIADMKASGLGRKRRVTRVKVGEDPEGAANGRLPD